MKRFRMAAVAVMVIAASAALVTRQSGAKGRAARQTTAWTKLGPGARCTFGFIDLGMDCIQNGNGQICTIHGYPAFKDEFTCQLLGTSFYYLRRPF